MADEATIEDKVTNTLAEIALNEEKSGSYFLTDEAIEKLSWEGVEELSLALNRNAVEKFLTVEITGMSTGIMISWRPAVSKRVREQATRRLQRSEKDAGNS